MSTIDITESFGSSGRSSPGSGVIPGENLNTPAVHLRILLAEDTEINRRLAIHLLGGRGHAVVVVENGRESVEAFEHGQYDVVLMDVQMPEMDGFEATSLIREKERATGGHIPIIAMTAHAMKGDRQRCLDSGMDGYVSKPIRPNELFQAIDEVVSGLAASARTTDEESTISQAGDGATQLDLSGLLASVNGSPVLLSKLVALFLKHYPRMLDELRAAINQGDGDWLARAAHTLRGGSGSFLTGSANAALTSLEAIGKTGSTNQGKAVLSHLEIEMDHIEKLLAGFVTEVAL